jgi:hypothetical protein
MSLPAVLRAFDLDDGYSNLRECELDGAAHLRLGMPPEATHADAEADLFVFSPYGDQEGDRHLLPSRRDVEGVGARLGCTRRRRRLRPVQLGPIGDPRAASW